MLYRYTLYVPYLCGAIILIYSLREGWKQRNDCPFGKSFLPLLFSALSFAGGSVFLGIELASLIGLFVLGITSFVTLHWNHRLVSLPFCILFLVTEGILLVLSFFCAPTLYAVYAGLMVLIFFLAENNQKFMRKSYEDSVTEYQNKIVQKQVDEVQNLYLTMRGWRHDYHNHLQVLKAHLSMGNAELAYEYLDQLESDLDSIQQLVESGNVCLDAILNSKLSLAIKQNIDVNYKATVPPQLTVSEIDLCVLIGNLIDNAVEACEKMNTGHRFIRLYIGVFREQLYISVTNATSEVIRKLDDEYITTKRGNHGNGLKRINNTVEKYDGYINRKNEPGVFATEVMLPL